MTTSLINKNVKQFIHTVLLWMPLWIGTTILFGLFGLFYVLAIKEDFWLASQGLLVREEANGGKLRLGRFDSENQMKTAQETILEVAKHRQVVAEALKVVGPKPTWFTWWGNKNWPSNGAVDATANSLISMHAPKGAEFGATEVIYLDVKQPSPERALEFSRALCNALEVRLQQVRKAKAESIISELTHARDSARGQLKIVTEQLQQFERGAGIELSDLRGMTDMIAGGGNSRIHLDQLKAEIRTAETNHQELLDDLVLLDEAISDPSSLVIAPSTLVASQPGLKRLREGYADAQLSASQLSGKFTDVHPLLIAARTTQDSIRNRLLDELEASKSSLSQEIQTSQRNIDRLRSLKTETETKLGGLAENRAEYANVISEVKTRSTILETAERELAEAEASSEASSSISLITRMDAPIVSDGPVGPGKATIIVFCIIAGLFFGLGIVFVISPNDCVRGFGRRINDLGRRSIDRSSANNPDNASAKDLDDANVTHAEAKAINAGNASTASVVENLGKPIMPSHPPSIEPSVDNKANDKDKHFRDRPAPIYFDESNLKPEATSIEVSSQESIESIMAELNNSTESLADSDLVQRALDEHPKDTSFREFLMSEMRKTDERRQQPRPAQTKAAPASLSLR